MSTNFDSSFTYYVLSQQNSFSVEFVLWPFWLGKFSARESKTAFNLPPFPNYHGFWGERWKSVGQQKWEMKMSFVSPNTQHLSDGRRTDKNFGHVLRKELEHLVITGKITGKTRGRQLENDWPNQTLDRSRKERGRDQKSKSETITDRRCKLILHKKKISFAFYLKCECLAIIWSFKKFKLITSHEFANKRRKKRTGWEHDFPLILKYGGK